LREGKQPIKNIGKSALIPGWAHFSLLSPISRPSVFLRIEKTLDFSPAKVKVTERNRPLSMLVGVEVFQTPELLLFDLKKLLERQTF